MLRTFYTISLPFRQSQITNHSEQCLPQVTPGWLVTVEGKVGSKMVYRTNRAGTQIKPDISQPIVRNILQNASREWGLQTENVRVSGAERIDWSVGCEDVKNSYLCDPLPVSGWFVTLEHGHNKWRYRIGDRQTKPELLSRDGAYLYYGSAAVPTFSSEAENNLRKIAAAHFQIKPAQVLFVEDQNTYQARRVFQDSCLGLGSELTNCVRQRIQGWEVTLAGKRAQRQTYRLDSTGKNIWSLASDGLPPRNDALANTVAKRVFQNASSRLQTPIKNLRIVSASVNSGGWRVQIRSNSTTLRYSLDLAGAIRDVNILATR